MTPSPTITSLPLRLSHCRTGLADNPSTVSVTIQRMLRLWPKLGADTTVVEMKIAVFGTAHAKKTIKVQNIIETTVMHIKW